MESQSQHILELSRELLDDVELSRIGGETLLLKASRLARLTGSNTIQTWIGYELRGYNRSEDLSIRYMSRTGRWTDMEKGEGYFGSLAYQEAVIAAEQAKVKSMQIPSTPGEYGLPIVRNLTAALNQSVNLIGRLSSIRSKVVADLHKFIVDIYYQKIFEQLAESIFDNYKKSVDVRISLYCGEVLQKIPSVMSRLNEGTEESISQALGTCRRILESFADAVYPPSDGTFELGGNLLKLDASKHQNRINVYVSQRCSSNSRRQKLRQNLANLFDRVSTGVHAEVSTEEARSLFLNTYLLLGEILHLDEGERRIS